MTRPKKGGGRHTPKAGSDRSGSQGPGDFIDRSELPNVSALDGLDPDAFEQAILDSSIDITGLDPDDLDLDALGLGDVDPLEILLARMKQSLGEGPAQFLEEVAGAAWMLHETVPEAERVDAVELYASFPDIAGPLMAALGVIGMTEDVRQAAAAKSSVLQMQGTELPHWIRALSDARVTAAGIGHYDPDDEVEVLAEVTIPEVNPFVVAMSRARVVHELLVEISTLIEPLQHLADDVNADETTELRIEITDPQRAADELAISLVPTIEWAAEDLNGLPVDNGVETVLPLARWVAELLPSSEVEPFFGFEGEQRDAALAVYTAGEADLDADHLAVIGRILDFSVEMDPFRWTPQRLITAVERLSYVEADPATVIESLRRFLPFAAKHHGTSDELLGHTLTVLDNVEQHAGEIFTRG